MPPVEIKVYDPKKRKAEVTKEVKPGDTSEKIVDFKRDGGRRIYEVKVVPDDSTSVIQSVEVGFGEDLSKIPDSSFKTIAELKKRDPAHFTSARSKLGRAIKIIFTHY